MTGVRLPLTWFPRLMNAPEQECNNYQLRKRGIHWDSLDEDISVGGLLAGLGDFNR
jgi:hypothetical protein